MHIKAQPKPIISAVNVVEGTLYVASFQKQDIQKFSHALLQIFLLKSNTTHVFSYNDNCGKVTLILDGQALSLFPRDGLTVSHGWRGLEVTLGTCGYSESGIIYILTSALARHRISIHYLSTYSTDYILVPEHQLADAINCFVHNFNIEITADVDEVMDSPSYLNTPDLPRPIYIEEADSTKLIISQASLCLASIDKDDFPLCMNAILNIIFFPKRGDSQHFFSFTATPTELSMILDQRDVGDFPQISHMSRKLLVETHPWRAIKRVEKASYDETQVVNSISAPLANAKISLLYLSMFDTSIILVRENTFQDAVDTLRKTGFEVLESA